MLKGLFRLIGVIVVVIVLVFALLFYLDGKGLLFGRLGTLVHTLRLLGNEAWFAVSSFSEETGIAQDAQGLLSQGIDILEGAVEPHAATVSPNIFAETPAPTATPEYLAYFSPEAAAASSVPTATPVPTCTPVPTATPTPAAAIISMG